VVVVVAAAAEVAEVVEEVEVEVEAEVALLVAVEVGSLRPAAVAGVEAVAGVVVAVAVAVSPREAVAAVGLRVPARAPVLWPAPPEAPRPAGPADLSPVPRTSRRRSVESDRAR
jgi:hypothetical protein